MFPFFRGNCSCLFRPCFTCVGGCQTIEHYPFITCPRGPLPEAPPRPGVCLDSDPGAGRRAAPPTPRHTSARHYCRFTRRPRRHRRHRAGLATIRYLYVDQAMGHYRGAMSRLPGMPRRPDDRQAAGGGRAAGRCGGAVGGALGQVGEAVRGLGGGWRGGAERVTAAINPAQLR